MHQALDIREVLHNVFSYLDERQDLAAVARACRLFFEVAIVHLYESFDTLQMDDLISDILDVDFTQGLTSEKLRNFRKYGVHVRSIRFNYEWVPEASQTIGEDDELAIGDWSHRFELPVYRDLRRALILESPLSLFPNLRTLSICAPQAWCLDIVAMLLVPTLEDLSLSVQKGSPGELVEIPEASIPVSVVLEKLRERCPLLRKLELSIRSAGSAHMAALLGTVVRTMKHLTTFGCDFYGIDVSVLRDLASHSHLRHLRIVLPTNDYLRIPLTIPAYDPSFFRNLRSVDVSGVLDTVMEVLPLFPSDVRDVALQITRFRFSDAVLEQLAKIVCSRFAELEAISLELHEAVPEVERAVEPWSLASMSAMFDYGAVEKFALACVYPRDRPLDLRDEHVLAIVSAWPKLELLSVLWQSHASGPSAFALHTSPGLTLKALRDIASHCSNIRSLQFTTINFMEPVAVDPQVPRILNLVTLTLATRLRTALPEAIATFLSLLWPYLCFTVKHEPWRPLDQTALQITLMLRSTGAQYALLHAPAAQLQSIYKHLGFDMSSSTTRLWMNPHS